MMIKFGKYWVNTQHINYIEPASTSISLYIEHKNGCATIATSFSSNEEMRQYLNDILIPSCNNNELEKQITHLTNKIMKMKNKMHEIENSFKFIAGGEAYKQAFKEYHEIIHQTNRTQDDKIDNESNE